MTTIRRQIEHKVNMGNYEHVIVSAMVEDEVDLVTPREVERISLLLDELVEHDLTKAREHTADTDSYVHSWET